MAQQVCRSFLIAGFLVGCAPQKKEQMFSASLRLQVSDPLKLENELYDLASRQLKEQASAQCRDLGYRYFKLEETKQTCSWEGYPNDKMVTVFITCEAPGECYD